MSMYEAALRQDIADAKRDVRNGGKPRNPFEAVIYGEARDQIRRENGK